MTDEKYQRMVHSLSSCLRPLVGVQLQLLKLPRDFLRAFEPSQVGTIVGTLMDAAIPELPSLIPDSPELASVSLAKHPGKFHDREGYPDFIHTPTNFRCELKLLYKDPDDNSIMKVTATRREPSARLTQKVTVKNVEPERDCLLLLSYQLQPLKSQEDLYVPTIVGIGVFPMIECILARDARLASSGGLWFGNYETPCVISRVGRAKLRHGLPLDTTRYGRKESEGLDFNEDTNFGKLKRIPYEPLQRFLRDQGAIFAAAGEYPSMWRLQ